MTANVKKPDTGRRAGLAASLRLMLLALPVWMASPLPVQAAGNGAQVPSIADLFDEDGVQMMYPSAAGSQFRLGARDPAQTAGFEIERHTAVRAGKEGGLPFWNLPSFALNYASGGAGLSSRLHVYASAARQRYSWKTQHGFLASPADFTNQEMTIYLRVHQISDPARAQISLKIRGGRHSDKTPDAASCVMLTLSPSAHGSVARFGKELQHPLYDYVTLRALSQATLRENVWIGLKLVSWNDPHDATRVLHRLYLDTDPFQADSGVPNNNWQLYSEYTDIAGVSTGRYRTLVNWGGNVATFRMDGFHDVDFAYPSVREIVVPQ